MFNEEWLPDVNVRYKYARNMTPLMIACTRGLVDTVESLLQRGANVLLKDKYGSSATTIVKYQIKEAKTKNLGNGVMWGYTSIQNMLNNNQ